MTGAHPRRLIVADFSGLYKEADFTRLFGKALRRLLWRARLERLRMHGRAWCDAVAAWNGPARWSGAAALAILIHAGSLATIVVVIQTIGATYPGTFNPEIRLELVSTGGQPGDHVVAARDRIADAHRMDDETRSVARGIGAGETADLSSTAREGPYLQPDEEPGTRSSHTPSSAEKRDEKTASSPDAVEGEGPPPAAHELGSEEGAPRAWKTWERQLLAHLARHKRDPTGAVSRGGRLTLSLTLDRTGHVVRAGILDGSGDTAIDHAALDMVQRADPVPPPPPSVADKGLEFVIPLTFRKVTKN